MRSILIDKPYKFVPPIRAQWPQYWLLKLGAFKSYLRNECGVVAHECRNLDLLRQSLQAGHAILLAANHCRTGDAVAIGHLANEAPCPMYAMASWHLFNMGWWRTLSLRVMGAFSVYREGLDRQAVDEAVNILHKAERPLLIFPEGLSTRTNDHLMGFMDGPAFIARTAARRRAKDNLGRVVIHPVAIRYLFEGDLEKACDPVLTTIEKRLTWRPRQDLPLVDRIIQVGNALLSLKELEYGLRAMDGGSLRQRQTNLVNHLLVPLEKEWLGGPQEGQGTTNRIKNLRMRIFPDMSRNELDEAERARRWRQLEDTYLAQQIDCYPGDYITAHPSVDRMLETVEKFEEDLTEVARAHGPMRVVVVVDEAIEVTPERDRRATEDPLMAQVKARLETKLAKLRGECRMYQPG